MLNCKRCNHEWNQKNITKEPNTCPRCKSTKWNEKKIRKWEKNGNLYVVLLTDGIKVGQTIDAEKRVKKYPGKKDFYVSNFSEKLKSKEKLLIKEAFNICGKPFKGREYFNGGIVEYKKIISFIEKIEGDIATEVEIKKEKESSLLYDIKKMAYLFALDSPNLKLMKETILQERKQFMISVDEAMRDSNAGLCTDKSALISLLCLASRMVGLAKEDLSLSLEDSIKKHEDIINDIASL